MNHWLSAFVNCIRFVTRGHLTCGYWMRRCPKLIPADWLSYNEVDLLHPEKTLSILKPEADGIMQRLFPRFNEVAHQHPLITGSMQSNDFPVHKISDFLAQPEFHELELYQDVYRHLGVEYQIAATIKLEPDRIRCCGRLRSSRLQDRQSSIQPDIFQMTPACWNVPFS
jgi:hypothetical protein